MVDKVAWLQKSAGFVHKVRESHSAFLCQSCYNFCGSYLAIEEFSGNGHRGVILLPEGKKWGWYGFVEVLCYLLSSFTSVNRAPPAGFPPTLVSLFAPVDLLFA